jgi:hypothetical protein
MDTYHDKLRAAGFPTDVLVIDFENYFDADYTMTKLQTIEYITDPRFEFTGVGWMDISDDSVPVCFAHDVPAAILGLQRAYGKNFESVTVVCHNARYDVTVLQEKFDIVPPYVVDTLDLARHYDSRMSHSLKDLAKMFKLEDKGETSDFKGLHLLDMTPEQRDDLAEYCKKDVRITAKLFPILMKLLTWSEVELPIARHTLGLYLNPQLNFDFELSTEIFDNMNNLLNEIIEPTGCSKKLLGTRKDFPMILENYLPEGEVVPYKAGKNEMIPALSKDDEQFQELLAHPDDRVRQLCVARIAVKSWPLHINRVKRMRSQALASYGSLRVPLNYYGCHTGRPSGGEKINLLNLGGKGRKGMGTHKLIAMVRKLLIAPAGKTLVINDSAQIEARLLAWLADQDDLVTGFADNEDIYSTFASQLFGVEVRKPTDAERDDPGLKDWVHDMDMMRGFGKDAILGAGYGMGVARFYNNCRANPDLRPLFDDGTYNRGFIERLIKTYRKMYSKIPEFWRQVEALFKFVIRFPNETATYDLHGEPKLKFWNDNGTVCLQLPSGRVLYYRHAAVGCDGNIRWQWGHLWGGSITENIIQSIGADLLRLWILDCEAENIPVVMHCYDEIVGLVDEETAEEGLSLMDAIMCEVPDWAEGCPLASEGMTSKFYTK